ncbi:MAG: hypothetical protein AB7T49_21535 [Oligoflexales bacterium]
MRRQLNMKVISVGGFLMIGLMGCGVWPVMNEEHGKRPFAMGKSDQVFWPWAPHPVHLNEEYGVAYRQALEGQIANPSSSNDLDQVQGGVDPEVTKSSLTRYQLMFDRPPFSTLSLGSKSSKSGGSSSSAPSSSSNSTGGQSESGYGGGTSK